MNVKTLAPPAAPFRPQLAARQVAPVPGGTAGGRIKVLLVDDDSAERDRIIDYLDGCGMCVTAISYRQQLGYQLAAGNPSLVLLDISISSEREGLALLQEIRSRSDVPVIATVAQNPDPTERVILLEAGADDCVARPFGLRELLARMRAVLRRRRRDPPAAPREAERACYCFDGWRLNQRTRKLTDPAGKPVTLTRGEYDLLVAFLRAPQRSLTREYLMQATRMHEDCFDRNIDVRVVRLRRKLEADPSAPRLIKTERGVGYRLDVPAERMARNPGAGSAAASHAS